jgi:Tol biopolymer transport system component
MDTKARTVSLSSVLTCLFVLTLGACDSTPAAVEPDPEPPTETPLDTIPLYTEACTPRPANPGVTGQIIFDARDEEGVSRLYVVHPDGSDLRELPTGDYNSYFPRWSRDGSKVAFESDSIRTTLGLMLYVMDVASGTVRAAAPDFYGDDLPMVGRARDWSPDGRYLLASACQFCDVATISFLYLVDLTRASEPKQLTRTEEAPIRGIGGALSPDGSQIIIPSDERLFILNADGSNLRRFGIEWTGGNRPAWSPDGCKLAFSKSPEGQRENELYYFDMETGETVRVTHHTSLEHYSFPRWSPDGQQLVFYSHRSTSENPSRDTFIYTVNLDGTGLGRVVDIPTAKFPDWSWAEPNL